MPNSQEQMMIDLGIYRRFLIWLSYFPVVMRGEFDDIKRLEMRVKMWPPK